MEANRKVHYFESWICRPVFLMLVLYLMAGGAFAEDFILSSDIVRVSVGSNGNQADDSSYTNDKGNIFVHDKQTRKTTRVSIYSEGVQGDDFSKYPTITSNGRYILPTITPSGSHNAPHKGVT